MMNSLVNEVPVDNSPVFTLTEGRVSVNVFRKETSFGPAYNITVRAGYKQSEDDEHLTWTNSIKKYQIPVASELMRQAYAWIKGAEKSTQ